jgi:hypothetical protein
MKEFTDEELEKKLKRSRVMSNFCKTNKLSEEFIEKHIDKWDKNGWYSISWYQELTPQFVRKWADKIDWMGIIFSYHLDGDFILEHWERFSQKIAKYDLILYLCKRQKLSREVIEKYGDVLTWNWVLSKSKVDEDLLLRYQHHLNFELAVVKQSLSLDFIKKHVGKLFDMTFVCRYQKLTEKFIKDNLDLMDKNMQNWHFISCNNKIKLSEKFIQEYKDKLSIKEISQTNKLSEEFIRENISEIDFDGISKKSKLSIDFIKEFREKLSYYYLVRYQQLSEDIIEDITESYVWNEVFNYQSLSAEFVMKHLFRMIGKPWHVSALRKNKKINQQELEDKGVYVAIKMMGIG